MKLSIAITPDQTRAYHFLALNEWLWEGDLDNARKALESMPDQSDPQTALLWAHQLTLERSYEEALEKLSSLPGDVWLLHIGDSAVLQKAKLYRLLGNPDAARAACGEASTRIESELEDLSDGSPLHGHLAIAYACLGRRPEAVDLAETHMDLTPFTIEAVGELWRTRTLALVYTMVGEHDAALDQIEVILSIPAPFSVPLLELDPIWDPLRDHPRYQEIVEKYALPSEGTS